MSDLAGFDLVVQVQRDSVEDVVDHVALSLPPGSTVNARLFGGPFLLVMTPQGWSVRTEVTARLEAVAETDRTRLVLRLADVLVVPPGGGPAVPLGTGQVVAETAIEARPILDAQGQTWLMPTLTLSTASWQVGLDPNSPLSDVQRAQLEQAIANALTTLLGVDHSLPLEVVRLVPGVDSHDPLVCPTPPRFCWIDAETLGIFVLYRDVPVPDPTLLRMDPLDTGPVFFYVPELVLARQLRIAVSRAGFDQVVRWQVVRELCSRWIRSRLLPAELAAVDRGPIRDQVEADLAVQDPDADEQKRALEVERRAHQIADQTVTDYFATPVGRALVEGQMPRPSGAGRLLVEDQLPAYVTSCDLRLAEGHLTASIRAEAEPPCGTIVGSQQLRVLLSTDGTSIQGRAETDGTPEIDIEPSLACTALAALLGGALAGPVWALFGAGALHGVATFLQWTVGTVARDLVPGLVDRLGPQGLAVPPLPVANRLTRIDATEQGLTVTAALAVSTVFNDTRPRVRVDLSVQRLPLEPPLTHQEINPDRPWGCRARTFTVSTRLLATQISAELQAENVALPWQEVSWTVQAGNRRTDLDPQPAWSGSPALVPQDPGETSVAVIGPARFPEPRPEGTWVGDHELRLGAESAGDRLLLRVPAGSGDRYLRVAVTATDALGTVHTSETFVVLEHERISHPPGYEDYHRECQVLLAAYVNDLVHREPPPRLRPVRGEPGLFRVRPRGRMRDLVLPDLTVPDLGRGLDLRGGPVLRSGLVLKKGQVIRGTQPER